MGAAALACQRLRAGPLALRNIPALLSAPLCFPSSPLHPPGCFVLYPPEGQPPRCLIEFIGGSFVGAAPQLAYRPLLEALAARGALVSALSRAAPAPAAAATLAAVAGSAACRSSPVTTSRPTSLQVVTVHLHRPPALSATPCTSTHRSPSAPLPQVVTVPYGTGFDHLRVADEVHFKFERCLKALGPAAIRLQVRRPAVGCGLWLQPPAQGAAGSSSRTSTLVLPCSPCTPAPMLRRPCAALWRGPLAGRAAARAHRQPLPHRLGGQRPDVL